jgi:hypothetical protein
VMSRSTSLDAQRFLLASLRSTWLPVHAIAEVTRRSIDILKRP